MASYTEVAVSSYNAATVPDDLGTVTATNKIQWSIIKTKLSDPLKTAIDSIDDNIAAAITTITANQVAVDADLDTTETNYNSTVATLYAPSGTVMLFMQTSAPTGWTKGSTHDNKALRLVSGAVSTGGSTAFTSVLASRTISATNMPSHTHTWADGAQSITFSPTTLYSGAQTTGDVDGWDGTGGQTHKTNVSVSTNTPTATGDVSGTTDAAGSGTAMDFAVRYVDVILATKS